MKLKSFQVCLKVKRQEISIGLPSVTPIKIQRLRQYCTKAFRPGHADYTYTQKYGFRDYRGGGRSSARETAMRWLQLQ